MTEEFYSSKYTSVTDEKNKKQMTINFKSYN